MILLYANISSRCENIKFYFKLKMYPLIVSDFILRLVGLEIM